MQQSINYLNNMLIIYSRANVNRRRGFRRRAAVSPMAAGPSDRVRLTRAGMRGSCLLLPARVQIRHLPENLEFLAFLDGTAGKI